MNSQQVERKEKKAREDGEGGRERKRAPAYLPPPPRFKPSHSGKQAHSNPTKSTSTRRDDEPSNDCTRAWICKAFCGDANASRTADMKGRVVLVPRAKEADRRRKEAARRRSRRREGGWWCRKGKCLLVLVMVVMADAGCVVVLCRGRAREGGREG